jgi:type I restriction enzyme S subunit
MNVSWQPTKLSKVLTPVSRAEDVDPTKEYPLLGVRLEGRGPFLRETVMGSQSAATRLFKVQLGDFIYSRLFAWRGAFGVIEPELDGYYVSGEFPTFRPVPGEIDAEFLRLWFCLPSTIERVEADCTGSTPLTRNRFKENFFLDLAMPLPPLPEQRKIVARIESLSAKIGEARSLRSESDGEAKLLGHPAADAVYKDLSDRYGCKSLAELCQSITDGDHLTPLFSDEGVKFIFVGNVSSGKLHFEGCKHVAPNYFASLKPQRVPGPGAILYSAVGATLGVPAIVETDEPFCFQRHIAILKPNPTMLLTKFGWYMLQSRTVFDRAWASTTGSAQPTVPLRAIRVLGIPTVPVQEQRGIIAYLDGLQTKMDALKKLQAETAAELAALLPSILDRAFKGQL